MTWQKKLGFLFLWTLSHGVSGALGLILAESAVQAKLLGSYSGIVGIIIFEGVTLIFKDIVFSRFREMQLAHSIDRFSWILAGTVIILGRLLGDKSYNDEFTPISFDIIRMSIFFAIGIVLTTHLPRIATGLKQKISNWHNQLEHYFLDRPVLQMLKYPFYVLMGLSRYIFLLVFLAFYFGALLFLSVGPIEIFKVEFQDFSWPIKTVWFGLSGVGYAGFLTGGFYSIFLRSDKSLSDLFMKRVQKG